MYWRHAQCSKCGRTFRYLTEESRIITVCNKCKAPIHEKIKELKENIDSLYIEITKLQCELDEMQEKLKY